MIETRTFIARLPSAPSQRANAGHRADFIGAVKQRTQNAAELKVPLIVEAEAGDNWDEAH